jgi:hypothetical protein
MKKMITIVGMVGMLCSAAAFAGSPKDIKYASKESNVLGGEYYIYNVLCSDGKTRKISAWDKRKEWCAGTKRSNCSNDQLKAAKQVCD